MLNFRHDATFRRVLQRELPGWVSEGLVTGEAARVLSARYTSGGDESGESSMQRLLIASIYAIGALLVGGGVISFVAANWAVLPAGFKVTILLAAMFTAHGLGYYWAFFTASRPALGQAFLVLGTLIFGANIGLFSQIFHLQGHFSTGFAVWAAGAAAMAIATRSIPTAALAIIVAFIAFYGGINRGGASIAYPLLIGLGGLGFAHGYRVPFIAVLSLLAAGITAASYPGIYAGFGHLMITGLLVSILYCGLGLYRQAPMGAFRLGLAGVVFLQFLLSFQSLANESIQISRGWAVIWRTGEIPVMAYALIAAIALAAVAAWVQAIRSGRLQDSGRMETAVAAAVAALVPGLLVVLGLLSAGGLDGIIIAAVANLALFGLAAALIRQGMQANDRAGFWAGISIIGVTIAARFFEYDTSLLLKSVVFIACGVAVLACGLLFERRLRPRETAA